VAKFKPSIREKPMTEKQKKQTFPAQQQNKQPGEESKMRPEPIDDDPDYKASGKLAGLTALISGGDSGIGRAVAILFAKEGAKVAIVYYDEHNDAKSAQAKVKKYGGEALLIPGDVGQEKFCREAVERTVKEFGRLDIVVNNAAVQFPKKSISEVSEEQIERTFRTNIFSMFFMVKAALPHLSQGSTIINTTSVTAYRGSPGLLDYSSTKGAITAFTRSLALSLVEKGIRVNAVAPGPIWTPLIPATFDEEKVKTFGSDVPMERAGQPFEVAPAYVFLASTDSAYMTGQVLHTNGGEVVNG
jgi:NAD(P)-dependent dehydrogenase (short-subunit alcohol dehydrogenase family)